jgi:hypothetical protein
MIDSFGLRQVVSGMPVPNSAAISRTILPPAGSPLPARGCLRRMPAANRASLASAFGRSPSADQSISDDQHTGQCGQRDV